MASRVRMMSRIWRWLLAIYFVMPLTGCTRDLVEVDKINVVLGFGVDLVGDNVRVSAQIVLPQGMKSNNPDNPSKNQFLLEEAIAKTLEQAMDELEAKLPRHIYLPHNTLVLYGNSYAEKGLARSFDFLERDRDYRRNELLLVTSGEARDVLKQNALPDSINVLAIRQLIQQFSEKSIIVESEQLRVIREFLEASHSPILTVVDVGPNGQPNVTGVGLFRGSKLIRILDMNQTTGLLWVTGPMHNILLNVPCESGQGGGVESGSVSGSDTTTGGSPARDAGSGSTFRVLSSNVNVTPIVKSGQLSYQVKVRGKAELVRLCQGESMDEKTLKRLEASLEGNVKQQIETSMKIVQESKSDAVQFGTNLFRSNPTVWRKYASNWDDIFSNLKISYDVQFHLLRTGLTASSPTSEFSREQLPPKAGREQLVK
ncbi:hypothetical protein JZ785_16245 [Alicyclobacillus curvatus]|nr:hypothetical protein JZ785_16245 [Alicyclobacillus curvatus]